jgi:hypothetical protein
LSRKSFGRLALAAVSSAAFAAPAFADPPAATVSGNSQWIEGASSQVSIFHAPGTVTAATSGPPGINSRVISSLGGTGDFGGHPGTSLHSDMSWSAGAVASAYNTSVLTYYFQISGPSGMAPVQYDASATFATSQLYRGEDYGVGFSVEIGKPLPFSIADVIAFSGQASGVGDDPYAPDPLLGSEYIGASANPNGPHSPYNVPVDCPVEGCSDALHLGGVANFQTNVVYEVKIFASSNLTVSGPDLDGSAMLDETIDPIFRIDPSDPDAGLYTLTFSPGVVADRGFPSGAPEPAVWSVMLLGFAGLGAQLRRRRPVRA